MGDQDGQDIDTLQRRLAIPVDPVLSVRRSVRPAAIELDECSEEHQERFIRAVELVALTSTELAYNFCAYATDALQRLTPGQWDPWVLHIMDQYDEGGTLAAIREIRNLDQYLADVIHADSDVTFDDSQAILAGFLTGLSGRPLHLQTGELLYSDTETLHLPAHIGQFVDARANFSLYKAIVAHQWAQSWFGTWRIDVQTLTTEFADPNQALSVFHAAETLRLDACIDRELPGLGRELRQLNELTSRPPPPSAWHDAWQQLRDPQATAETSARVLASLYGRKERPAPACYQGVLLPELTQSTIQRRQQKESAALAVVLRELLKETGIPGNSPSAVEQPEPASFTIADNDAEDVQLLLNGEPISINADTRQLLNSVVQDNGDLPPECMVAAGHGGYAAENNHAGADTGTDDGEDANDSELWIYDEWDYTRKRFRHNFCLLRERQVLPHNDNFVEDTLNKYRGLIKHLNRNFEALRGLDSTLKKQPSGDTIDLDTVIEALADQRAGLEGTDNLFIDRRRINRDIAVMFMVDMSGSTKGWINDLEREALVLLCESLETLGDRYAIYGFSGYTHKRCEVFPIKQFDEPYNTLVRGRISGLRPQEYTRMGAIIRHLTAILSAVEARTRILITLSDGRPDDQDGYRGTYGIEDTRQALIETRYQGIHPYCITIDDEAVDYLPHMYGKAGYAVISDVAKLPYKVSDIYRRITV